MSDNRAQETEGLDHLVLWRPIARWADDEKVAANPVTQEIVHDPIDTPRIPRPRIAGVHIDRVGSEMVPVCGYRDGHYVLAIAPEHASVDVFDPSDRDPGEPALEVTEPWVPLVAVFTSGERGAVVVPRKEVEL